jgi:hypothetical protein
MWKLCALAQYAFPRCAAVELWVGPVMVARAAQKEGAAYSLACQRA